MEAKTNEPSQAIVRAAQIFEMAASWVAIGKLKKITSEQALKRPAPGLSNIYWLIGHMAASCDIAPYINGADRVIDDSLDPLFDMGTKPQDDASGYPSIDGILENFEKGIADSLSAIKSVGEADLNLPPAKPLGEPLNQYFKTRYDIILGFATHLTYHGGQVGTILSLLEK
ncbi:MAG: DinB family protein [FCB group bacterium]|nr:DinB family protein [FCB group bacterium]